MTQRYVAAFGVFSVCGPSALYPSAPTWGREACPRDARRQPALFVLAALLAALLLLLPVQRTVAQPVALERLPTSAVNRPELDLFDLRRPALSLTSFDNAAASGYDPAHGLGLKQVLELRYQQHDPLVVPVFDRIVEVARRAQADPYGFEDLLDRRRQLDRNTNILQSRAFEALVTLVLALNGQEADDLASLGLRSHEEAMSALTAALSTPPGGVLISGEDLIDDPVKYSRSLCNVARALDLYLALENAYAEFAGEVDASLLLSEAERAAVMGEYGATLLGVDALLGMRATDIYAGDIGVPDVVRDLLLLVFEYLPAGDRVVEEVEPGNYALKLRVATGYGALAVQAPSGSEEAAALTDLQAKARRSLEVTGEQDESRLRHWNFMTYGGKRFWAESAYYLDWSVEQALPFWHAVRAGGLLGATPDPFSSAWFTNPLHWHADLVTPDGRIAPLDDGNKAAVRYGGLMRWAPGYGDDALGRKYAWIEERLGGPARREETLLVELGIPRTAAEQPPAARVVNPEGPLDPHVSEQQLVARNPAPSGETSYVLLNGEHGKAVDHGEGHEQPDQLQLLYYLGDTSYLLDSGYDRAFTVENSTWNHYYDHNVLTIGDQEGGLKPPQLRLFQARKASEPWFMGEVKALYAEEYGAVTVLRGEQPLVAEPWLFYRRADYARDVLLIGGADPYLIDVSTLQHRQRPLFCSNNRLRVRYHANSDRMVAAGAPVASGPLADYAPREDGFLRWEQVGSQEDRALYAFPVSVEHEFGGVGGKQTVSIQKLVLDGPTSCVWHWSVATLLQAQNGGKMEGEAPALLWPADAGAEHQGWVWPRGSGGDVYDVFAVRSVAAPEAPVTFRLSQADAEFPDVELALPAGLRFGFARVQRSDGMWRVDPDHQVGLEGAEIPAVPAVATSATEEANTTAEQVPATFSLMAYPNPVASPTATVQYQLAEEAEVHLQVYDVLGRKVQVLLTGERQAPGRYERPLDTSRLAPGAYFVRLQAGAFKKAFQLHVVR